MFVFILLSCIYIGNTNSVYAKAFGIKKAKINQKDNIMAKEETLKINNVILSIKEMGSGQDMILIHGRTLSKEAMDNLFEYYKNQYHVISYDVRGHGKTQSRWDFSLDDLSDEL